MHSGWKRALCLAFVALVCAVGCGDEEVAAGGGSLDSDAGADDAAVDEAEDAGTETDAGGDGSEVSRHARRPEPDAGGGDSTSGAAGASATIMQDAGSAKEAASAPAADAGATPASASGAPQAGEIETVVLEVLYTLGVGGGVYPDLRPVLLFRDGTACRDMNYVVKGLDPAAHRAQFPDTWTEWQETDGKIALKSGDSWQTLRFQLRFAPHARGLTLDASFERVSGGGDSAQGTVVIVQKTIALGADGKFAHGSFTGVSTPDSAFSSSAPEKRGSYVVDGYVITLSFEDGTTTRTSFVWSAEDERALYIGGSAYVAPE